MVISDDQVERLAQAIHANYVVEQTRHGVAMSSTPAMTAWESLDEDKRENSRAQARDMENKLARIGCGIGRGTLNREFAFTDDELNRLARDEAARWNEQRVASGWTHGTRRDEPTKVHPLLLVSWDDLPESERDKDRDAVRSIPALLASIGLRVVRRRLR